jgi:hypothetical protein
VNVRARSLHTALLGVTIAIIAIVTPAARAGAAGDATCSTTSGVTVLVDFTSFHRPISRGCAPGQPATALAAIQAAGFSTAGTTQYGDAFVCRIDNLPTPQTEACAQTPPAKSSWSFYDARATDTAWTFTPVGVLGYRPPSGTIIAFAFGDGAKPSVAPSVARGVRAVPTTTTAKATTTTPPSVTPLTAASTNPTVVAAAAPTTVSAPATVATTAHTAPATATTAHTTTSIAVSSKRATARIVDRPPITHRTVPADTGSPTGVVLAALLVVGLGVAAALTIRARRRRAT